MTAGPETARSDEWPAALHLLFQHLPDDERRNRVANALTLLERGELDPDGVFVLREAGAIVGVLACLPLRGAMGLVWPPSCLPAPEAVAREDCLVRHAAAWLRGRGVKLAQSLFSPGAVVGADALERNGFVHLTQLWYLRHALDLPPHCLATPARLDFVPADDDPDRFAETLVRTYEGTQDCPEINGVRTTAEVLDGHRAQGVYDPGLWWLARYEGRPVGVLLAGLTPDTGEWEVAYVGVVPEARRHGFGRELMLNVLCEARAAGVPGVTLSVDGRNEPAGRLYRDLGFEPVDRREVYLAIWREPAA